MNENSLLVDEGSLGDYFSRVHERFEHSGGPDAALRRAWFVASSGEDHFARFELPYRRYLRARACGDTQGMSYEKRTMLSLLYEIADTAYLVMSILDPNTMDLQPSADGFGVSGERAAEVVKIVDLLESQCERLLRLEAKFGLRVDFSRPVDEIEGITFKNHRHWQDFVPGSLSGSFDHYFAQARKIIIARLNEKLNVLPKYTVRQYLHAKGRRALLEVLRRLEQAAFSPKLEKIREGEAAPARHAVLPPDVSPGSRAGHEHDKN